MASGHLLACSRRVPGMSHREEASRKMLLKGANVCAEGSLGISALTAVRATRP